MIGQIIGGIASAVSAHGARKGEKLRGELELRKERLALERSVLEGIHATNVEQAKHPSMWVAGARPGSLWLCNAGLLYAFVIHPIWSSILVSMDKAPLPPVDTTTLMALTGVLLGVGGYRSLEKWGKFDTKQIAKRIRRRK